MRRHIIFLQWQLALQSTCQLRMTCQSSRRIIPRRIATLITGIKYLLAARYAVDIINKEAVPHADVITGDVNTKRYYDALAVSYAYKWFGELPFGIVHIIYGYVHGIRKYTDGDFISYYNGMEHGHNIYAGIYSIKCDNRIIYSRYIK